MDEIDLFMRKHFPKFYDSVVTYWGAIFYYYRATGKILHYRNPRDFNEKLMWLSRYWQHPLKTKCADKYLVREYVKECGLEDILIPLLGVYDNADEIDFDSLPDSFVLKCNHGCDFNIVCPDKSKLNIDDAKSKLSAWMRTDFGRRDFQFHYLGIPHKIICEQYLSSANASSMIDYKIYCINGEPQFFLVCSDRDPVHHFSLTLSSYSLDWERLNYLVDEDNRMNDVLPRPHNIEKLIDCARVLARPFPFVRVDLYESSERALFGELTFTPAGNTFLLHKDSALKMMGDKLVLPSKYLNNIG